MQKINTQNISDFDILLEEMNRDLFNKELSDIVEVTYAYADLWNWVFLNKTLFWTFLSQDFVWVDDKVVWENVAKNMLTIYYRTKYKLIQKKNLVAIYKEKLQSFLTKDFPKAEILYDTLSYISKIIDLTLTGLVFEWEKAWFLHNLSEDEIEENVAVLEHIETSLFWWNIRENEYEVQGSFEVLTKLFEKQKQKLTPEEQERFSWYLQTLKQSFPYIIDSTKNDTNQSKKLETFDIFSREIPRENYVQVLKLAMEIYGIDKPVIVEERSSIYDGEEYLGIPNSEGYKTLKIQRILELIQHEIETHYIIEKNNGQTLGRFRWGGNLPREEWLAMTAEGFLRWENLEDIEVSWAIPDLLMWEILLWNEYKDFHILLSKLKDTQNASWLFLRRKRNYPLDYKWVQHKDTSYNRGQHKIVEFIKWWWNIKDLYVGKVSFEDIGKTKEIVEEKNIKLIYPLLIWELLQYVILLKESWRMQRYIKWGKLKPQKFIESDFWNYIEWKYPFLNIRQEIVNNSIERLTFSMKRKVVQILNILK